MMSTASQNKKLVPNGYGITDLPECILSNILSRLSTKEAVRTSVLSKAWERKWTCISRIEIDNYVDDDNNSRTTKTWSDKIPFIYFMNRIFLLPPDITSFYLHINDEYGKDYIETWISSLFIRNVQSVALVVDPSSEGSSSFPLIVRFPYDICLPRSLLSCTSLTELKVDMYCTFKVPNNICNFLKLTRLSLSSVHILNVTIRTNTLAFTFPVLEELEIRTCVWSHVKFVDIFAPALCRFAYETEIFRCDDYFKIDEVYQYRIKIHGASLTRFESSGWYQENIEFVGTTVDCADIKIYDTKHVGAGGLRIRRLMKELSGLRKLELSGFVAQALAATKSVPLLPVYYTLREITLSGWSEWGMRISAPNIEALFDLLRAAPFLIVLSVNMDCVTFLDNQKGYDYEAVEPVPSCVASHLKLVHLGNFENKSSHFHLAMYFLKNAANLRRFLLFSQKGNGKEDIWNKVSEFQKASTSLKFVFT